MSEVFCNCFRCKRDIVVGESMITLTLSTEKIETVSSVQPTKCDVIQAWCTECASIVVKEITTKIAKAVALDTK